MFKICIEIDNLFTKQESLCIVYNVQIDLKFPKKITEI